MLWFISGERRVVSLSPAWILSVVVPEEEASSRNEKAWMGSINISSSS